MSSILAPEVRDQITESSTLWRQLQTEIGKKVIGQKAIIEQVIIALLCNGHVLLEGLPGLAKTTLVNALSDAIGLDFSRVQFTPDLLPSDLIGTVIYSPKTEDFHTKQGPIFSNIILADEINRAPAKVQSALLEAMQEKQVTIGETSYKLPSPFFVLATQNPIDQEGTYQLPEAQLDRFMLKLLVHYPTKEEEKSIITSVFEPQKITRVITQKALKAAHELVNKVYIDEKVVDYILSLVFATREPSEYIIHGASPRATLKLFHAAKAAAFLAGRHFVIPDDVKRVTPAILRHRLLLSYHAEAERVSSDQIIDTILTQTPSP